MNKILKTALILCLPIISWAGNKVNIQIENIKIQKVRTVTLSDITEDYNPLLIHKEMPNPDGEKAQSELNRIKNLIKERKEIVTPLQKTTLPNPVVIKGFEGNRYPTGIPNDNDMAISNQGFVVSVVNKNLSVFDTTGTLLQSVSLQAFSNSNRKENKYDPRAIYDSKRDRFIIGFLNDNYDTSSYYFLCFSKTNNPMGAWDIYMLSGSPLKDSTWVDYPIMALSDNSLFLTLNAIKNNVSWELGFKQSYIWQIDLADAYNNNTLNSKLYHGIKFNNKPLRNICPVGYSTPNGKTDLYFISNRNLAAESDSFFVLHINSSVSDTNKTIDIKHISANNKYGVAPNAKQPLNKKLATNDCRNLHAIMHNGIIHTVGNSIDLASNKATVFHGRVDPTLLNPILDLHIFQHPTYEFGYPAIAYAGRTGNDDDMIIVANYTSDTSNPGMGCFYYKGGAYSDYNILKRGGSFIQMIGGTAERWGDYSGIQRRYNKPGEVWMAATWGNLKQDGFFKNYTYFTWISAVRSIPGLIGIPENNPQTASAKLYPNPLMAQNLLYFDFEVKIQDKCSFKVIETATGKTIQELLYTTVKEGKNQFSFNIQNLPKGNYILQVSGSKTNLTKPFVR